jgi:hypothetical protein
MKKNTVCALLCLALALTLLAGCSGGEQYKDDVPVSELVSAVETAVGFSSDDMIEAPEAYVSGTMRLDVSRFADSSIRMNSRGVNVDEFGIIKVRDEAQLSEVKADLEAYLQFRADVWMADYMPQERPKVDNAEIKTAGNYVIFFILSEEAKSAGTTAFEDALK